MTGWNSVLKPMQETDPEFAEAFSAFAGLDRTGALSAKMRALITFGLNVAVSQLNADAAREAAYAARARGASREELLEVAQLTVLLGIHSVVLVADFLADKASETIAPHQPADIAKIKAAYLESRGFIPPPVERFLEIDPDFVDAYRRLSEIPFRRAHLTAKDAELIVIALDASVNHLHQTGCQAHISAAMAAGASALEVAEALQLAAAIAGQGTALGFFIANEVFGE